MSVKGVPQLRARLKAITPDKGLMQTLALSAVREQKLLVPRKTGNLGRTIRVGRVTPTEAETIAGADYALFVERGTRAHTIVPKKAKALRFTANPASATLSGRVRNNGKPIFAKRVRHPGTKAQPFMEPGAKKALEGAGFKGIVIEAWNDAA